MKELQFLKELKEMNLEILNISCCYGKDIKGNVKINEEAMNQEFEMKMRELKEILE